MGKVNLILTGLSLNIILLSINRLTDITSGTLAPFGYLRWLDFNAMLPIPLMAIILYWLLKNEISKSGEKFLQTGAYLFLSVVMVTGIYLFGTGSGTHEFANYLHFRYCNKDIINDTLCNIIIYNDDSFSHYVYYAGFILLNTALMLFEYNMPRKKPASRKDLLLVLPNAVLIGLGIFANLAFEEIGIDLYVFGSVMLLSLFILYKKGWHISRLPVTYYFAVSYVLGVVGSFIWKTLVS